MRLLENTAFRDGNLVSLLTARPHIGPGRELLVMNIDHIYRPAIAKLAAAPVDDVTAFIDTDRTLGADDMKVERDPSGKVHRISKTLSQWDAGYVGMTKLPATAEVQARYWATVDATLAAEGRAVHVERVLARLAESAQPAHRAANLLLTSLLAAVIVGGVLGTVAHTACCFVLKH